jgi:hypothetical protein
MKSKVIYVLDFEGEVVWKAFGSTDAQLVLYRNGHLAERPFITAKDVENGSRQSSPIIPGHIKIGTLEVVDYKDGSALKDINTGKLLKISGYFRMSCRSGISVLH